ncbi:MAG TPA: SCO family protein [Burkholderiales bacterium]|nr:SCO family protein [Burkholderiales bacterium]
MNRIVALLLSLLFTSIATGANEGTGLKAGVFSPPRLAPEFSLRGSDGAELKLSRYRGKVVLLAFGFTHCSEVCPVTLAVLAQARKQLGVAGNEMQVVYVTVDPERDNAEYMRKYLSGFDTTFIGGTGLPDQLAAVRKNYGVVANKVASAGGYSVDHSSYVYLIDRRGNLRAMMPYGHSAGDYVHDVKILLKQ